MLCGFSFHFTSSFKVWKKRCVDVHNIISTNICFHLTKGFKEWKTFNITNCTTNFCDDNVRISCCRGTFDFFFQSVCDVWNNLDSCTKIFTFTFFTKNFAINFTSCYVRIFVKVDVNKTFIVTKVKVSFSTIVCHVNFTVLIGAHCTWVNVNIRVKFLDSYFKTAIFQKTTKTCSHDSLTDRRNNTTSNKNILSH